MIQNNSKQFRAVALLTGGAIAASFALQPAPAQAVEKEKLYKGGAVALGVLGAYWILKGNTVPGAVAGAGAYYAYKKGKDVQNENRYDDYSYDYDRRNQDYNYSRVAPDRNETTRNNGSIVLR